MFPYKERVWDSLYVSGVKGIILLIHIYGTLYIFLIS